MATSTMAKYDPLGPIAATLYAINDSELVEEIISHTGVPVAWPQLDERSGHSHKTRIRAYRPAILAAYNVLADDEKGRFAQVVARRLSQRGIPVELRRQMLDSLAMLGWTITEDGWLTTQDALLSEQFFPPGTYYDAYVAIRQILAKATTSIAVIDAYIGNTLFTTLSAIPACAPSVFLLTTDRALKPDFKIEASNFQKQLRNIQLQVRTTQDFHDRFIVIDGKDHYHVGASIKDAGHRAFLISKLEDAPIIAAIQGTFASAWNSAKVVI